MHQHIEYEILKYFKFLQEEFDFPMFERKWWRDEFYITAKKNQIEFSVYTVMGSESCPSIKVINHKEKVEFDETITPTNQYYVDEIEQSNSILNSIENEGKENISKFIEECANILKRNPESLNGDTSKLRKRKPLKELNVELYKRDIAGGAKKTGKVKINSIEELAELAKPKKSFFKKLIDKIIKASR